MRHLIVVLVDSQYNKHYHKNHIDMRDKPFGEPCLGFMENSYPYAVVDGYMSLLKNCLLYNIGNDDLACSLRTMLSPSCFAPFKQPMRSPKSARKNVMGS